MRREQRLSKSLPNCVIRKLGRRYRPDCQLTKISRVQVTLPSAASCAYGASAAAAGESTAASAVSVATMMASSAVAGAESTKSSAVSNALNIAGSATSAAGNTANSATGQFSPENDDRLKYYYA